MSRWVAAVFASSLLAGCPASTSGAMPDAGGVVLRRVISDDVLARPPETSTAVVKHVLVSWGELHSGRAHLPPDPRAMGRSRGQAEGLALDVLDRARRGEEFNALMAAYSEDPSTARTASPITVQPTGTFEPNFQALALRLHVDEVGVCLTAYGLHVMKRIQ